MIVLKTKIGKGMIEFEGQTLKDVCKFSALVGMLPEKCSVCGKDDIHLTHKNPGGNDYYGLKCKCGAEQNFHQRKEGGGFYIQADDKFTVWEGKPADVSPPANGEKIFDDDSVPF